MRKLGLDVGTKSCGIALSDPLNIIAQGKENFFFKEGDWNNLIDKIKFYLKKFEIDIIVIGYPTMLSGSKSSTTIMIENFKNKLEQKITQKIILIDENHTTKKANEILIKTGLTRKKRKKYKDQISAQLILEDYLARL